MCISNAAEHVAPPLIIHMKQAGISRVTICILAAKLQSKGRVEMVYVIIVLNVIIIFQLIGIRMSIPERDYVEEALRRDEKQRKQKQWQQKNRWKS